MNGAPRPDRHVARLLCANGALGRSGLVQADRGKLRRIFCLENGALVFATSNLLEEQFGEFLVRRRLLTPGDRAAIVSRASSEKKRFGEVLLAASPLGEDTLRDAAAALARELLSSTLEWPDGEARFEAGLPRLEGEITFRLIPFELILSHCRRYPISPEAVRLRLGPPDVRPGRTVDADRILGSIELPGPIRPLLARCDGATPLPVLVDGGGDPEGTLRTLYALMLAGVVEPVQQKVRVASDAPLTREECEARLASATSGDLYAVLGVARDAQADSIRAAYYTIARRYHPDRFRSGELQDLLPRFESFFASVTEAHNTLGDPGRRAEYDRESVVGKADSSRADTVELARQNYLRGRALAAQRRYGDALSFLENAVRQDERRPEYRLELGLLLARNPRRRADAETHLLAAAEAGPSLARAYRGLGEIYLRAEFRAAGCRLLREALKWDPDDIEAAELLREAQSAGRVPEESGPLLRRRFPE